MNNERTNAERRRLNAEGISFSVYFLVFGALLLFISPVVLAQTTQPTGAGVLKLEGVPLADALEQIRVRAGLNMSINWNAIQTLGVDKTTPISVEAHGLSTGRALALILDIAGPNHELTYFLKGGIVYVTTQQVADQDMVTRVYPIEDLLVGREHFQNVPFINIANSQAATVGGGSQQSSLQSSGQPSPQQVDQQRQDTVQSIITAITSSIRPEIWKQNGGNATILYINGNLIITAPRSVQGEIGVNRGN